MQDVEELKLYGIKLTANIAAREICSCNPLRNIGNFKISRAYSTFLIVEAGIFFEPNCFKLRTQRNINVDYEK